MAVDNTVVQKVEAPDLTPIVPKNRLAPAPIHGPRFSVKIKNTEGNEISVADPNITRALVALMNVHAVNGGAACHWGGPAALAEAMAAIHSIMFTGEQPWHESYNFVNDAGHTENGVYALRANYGFDGLTFKDLRDFRSIKSKLTGHGESHLNPEGVLLSNGPLGSSLPQAQGLAIGDHFSKNKRVTLCVLSDGAAMEGEAKESFAAIPGLAARGLVNPFVLILSDNDTKLSGRITEQSFNMQGSFDSFSALGWEVVKVPQGNNLQEVYLATEKAINLAKKNPAKPVVLWLKTVKGFGIKKTELDASGGHGFPLANAEKIIDWLQEITANKPPQELMEWAEELLKAWVDKEAIKTGKSVSEMAPAVKKTKIQAGLSDGAIQAAKDGLPVFSVSADLAGSTGMSAFQKTFPGRSIDIGIAESNMVSTAAGLSKVGFIPIVDTFAQFGVTKGNLPLTMAALSQAPVIAVFSHAGFQDAADGASHQATTYLAATSSIPHTAVIVLSCASEAQAYMYQAIKRIADARKAGRDGETVIFFLGRENYPIYWQENPQYVWGKAQVLREGKDVTLIANGALVGNALKAADQLKEKGISAAVINNAFVNQVDLETISRVVKGTGGRFVTVDDHQVIGGSGAQVVHALVQAGVTIQAKSLGIQGEFGQSAYMADELYEKHGLGAAGIMSAAQALLK